MSTDLNTYPAWLTKWMTSQEIPLWGAADLNSFHTPLNQTGKEFSFALSFAIPMNPEIMVSIQTGPNQEYADEYKKVNDRINELSTSLAAELLKKNFQSKAMAASVRTDTINIKGDFPHKTAATRAGLGWIGKHCQLVTSQFGSWVRLGTVFTDLYLPCGPSMDKEFCGNCNRCVTACPAKALKDTSWYPGIPRKKILDVRSCDKWKKENYYQYHKGHNCGICSSVCPYGLKFLKNVGCFFQ